MLNTDAWAETVVKCRLKFHELDTDGDEHLSSTEAFRLVNWIWLQFLPEGKLNTSDELEEAARLQNSIDKNKDGLIDFGEFNGWLEGACEWLQMSQLPPHQAR